MNLTVGWPHFVVELTYDDPKCWLVEGLVSKSSHREATVSRPLGLMQPVEHFGEHCDRPRSSGRNVIAGVSCPVEIEQEGPAGLRKHRVQLKSGSQSTYPLIRGRQHANMSTIEPTPVAGSQSQQGYTTPTTHRYLFTYNYSVHTTTFSTSVVGFGKEHPSLGPERTHCAGDLLLAVYVVGS